MEMLDLLGCLACISAGLSAVFCVRAAGQRLFLRFSRGNTLVGGGLLSLVRNGICPFKPVARLILKLDKVHALTDDACVLLAERGFLSSSESLLSLACALCLLFGLLGFLFSGSFLGAVAFPLCSIAFAASRVQVLKEKRADNLREEVPGALRSMEVSFQAGLSLLQSLHQAKRELRPPLRDLFVRAANRMEVGRSAKEALEELKQNNAVPQLCFVAAALDIHQNCGGSLRAVLESARQSVEASLDLERSLRVQTAQAKLSARIVCLLPFVLLALFSVISEGFLDPFFESFSGICLLALALLMQISGILLVRRMLKVKLQ